MFRDIADFKLTVLSNRVIARAIVRLPDINNSLLFTVTANNSETAREKRAAILLRFHYIYFVLEDKETALQLATTVTTQSDPLLL